MLVATLLFLSTQATAQDLADCPWRSDRTTDDAAYEVQLLGHSDQLKIGSETYPINGPDKCKVVNLAHECWTRSDIFDVIEPLKGCFNEEVATSLSGAMALVTMKKDFAVKTATYSPNSQQTKTLARLPEMQTVDDARKWFNKQLEDLILMDRMFCIQARQTLSDRVAEPFVNPIEIKSLEDEI